MIDLNDITNIRFIPKEGRILWRHYEFISDSTYCEIYEDGRLLVFSEKSQYDEDSKWLYHYIEYLEGLNDNI